MISPKQVGLSASVADMPFGGVAPVSSIERYRSIRFSQMTAGQSIALPSPLDTSIDFSLDVMNDGAESFMMSGMGIAPSSSTRLAWSSGSLSWSPVSSPSIFNSNGKVVGYRTVDVSDYPVSFQGLSKSFQIGTDGEISASSIVWDENRIFVNTANPALDIKSNSANSFEFEPPASGTVSIENPSSPGMPLSSYVKIGLLNLAGIDLPISFGSEYYNSDGSSPVSFTLENDKARQLEFQYSTDDGTSTAKWILVTDTAAEQSSPAGVDVIQEIDSDDTVNQWGSLVIIGNTPLTSDITITLPSASGNVGSHIKFVRVDNEDYKVTLEAAPGETLSLLTNGSELNVQNGGLTLQPQSSTTINQVSNNAYVAAFEGGVNNGITNGFTFGTTPVDIAGSSFTIPSAGKWEIKFNFVAVCAVTLENRMSVALFDSLNNIVPGTVVVGAVGDGVMFNMQTFSGTAIVDTSGPKAFKLRGRTSLGSCSIYNSNTFTASSTEGSAVITWKKIGGFVPVSGQIVDHIYAGLSANQTAINSATDLVFNISNSGNIPLNTATGVFTLKAGKTYEMSASLRFSSLTGGTGSAVVRWMDTANLPLPNSQPSTHYMSSATTPVENSNYPLMVFTPNVDMGVKLRAISVSGGPGTLLTSSVVVIKQLGSSVAVVDEIDPSRSYETIYQNSHGFSTGQAVRHNGTEWVAAQALLPSGACHGVVTQVSGPDSFVVTTHGRAVINSHGLTVGQYYWLSQATPGLLTATQPSSGVVQGVLHVRNANTVFINIGTALSL